MPKYADLFSLYDIISACDRHTMTDTGPQLNTLCLKKRYHPTTNNNFNSSSQIPVIFGTNTTHEICHWKVVYFPTSPVQCLYLTLGNFRNLNSTKSAVKEHLFIFLRINQVIFTLFVQDSFLVLWEAYNKCSKCCQAAHTHTVSRLICLLMAKIISIGQLLLKLSKVVGWYHFYERQCICAQCAGTASHKWKWI